MRQEMLNVWFRNIRSVEPGWLHIRWKIQSQASECKA
jgi:hypothetical protein